MKYTTEQAEIISAIESTSSDIKIRAYAGCAKTSTLLAAIAPNGQINPKFNSSLLLAFAKSNEQDFRKKLDLPLTGPTQPTIRTINALGYGFIKSIIGSFPKLDSYKLRNILEAKKDVWKIAADDFEEILEEVQTAMVNGLVPAHPFARRRLDIADAQTMSSEGLALLRESIKLSFAGVVDFTDQIYLPAFFATDAMLASALPNMGVDTVFVDEAQDFSRTNILFLRLLKPERLIVVGDPNQSIYGFRGAKDGAMEALLEGRDYKQYPLSASFRVPHSLSARYKHYAEGFHSHESCGQGEFEIFDSWSTSDIPDGAAILCRNNAPLIGLCFRLIRDGRSATIAGRNIGITLANKLKKICPKQLSIAAVGQWQQKENDAKPKRLEYTNDVAECLIAFIDAFGEGKQSSEAQDFLRQMFKDGAKITLSTGHKAKGLEWETVFHLDPWRIGYKTDPHDAFAMKQENNLRYVIETRAKKRLVIINLNQMEKIDEKV